MPNTTPIEVSYKNHRILAAQLHALYVEINKLALKKPTDSITPLIAKKINHVIVRVKQQVRDDEFLDAIETMPVEGQLNRFDEVLIVTAELLSAMERQRASEEYSNYYGPQNVSTRYSGR